jgi:hypothetical protein
MVNEGIQPVMLPPLRRSQALGEKLAKSTASIPGKKYRQRCPAPPIDITGAPSPFGFEVRSKGVKRTEWLAVVSALIGAQVILYRIEAANRIGRAAEGLGATGFGLAIPVAPRRATTHS